MPRIEIGDTVCYRVCFLRSIAETTGDMPHAQGIVTDIKTLATIKWKDGDWPLRVNVQNLARRGSLAA